MEVNCLLLRFRVSLICSKVLDSKVTYSHRLGRKLGHEEDTSGDSGPGTQEVVSLDGMLRASPATIVMGVEGYEGPNYDVDSK